MNCKTPTHDQLPRAVFPHLFASSFSTCVRMASSNGRPKSPKPLIQRQIFAQAVAAACHRTPAARGFRTTKALRHARFPLLAHFPVALYVVRV